MTDNCKRCGACCVYFLIRDEPEVPEGLVLMGSMPLKVFKQAGEPCQHLSFENGLASCAIHDSKRPDECQIFNCNYLSLRYNAEAVRAGLEETRRQIREGSLVHASA